MSTDVFSLLESAIRATRLDFQRKADAADVTDTEINQCKSLIKLWKVGETVEVDNCRTYLDKVYRVRQGHTTQANYTPDITPALWAVIDTEHAGTLEDPIPASRGMDYIYGKYYLDPEDSKVYICNGSQASQEKPNNLQYLPHELIGHYFTAA